MSTNEPHKEHTKPCRACNSYTDHKKSFMSAVNKVSRHRPCPLDREALGRHTWGYLHTMAAYWTETPSQKQSNSMKQFIRTFSKTYPCEDCAYALREWMREHPPKVGSQEELSRWFCQAHNEVNERLGKKLFDCNLVGQRWIDGWKDGSCDWRRTL